MTTPLQLLLLLLLPWVAIAADLGRFHDAVPGFEHGLDLARGLVTPRPAPEAVTAEVESLLEPPLDVGPPADAAADRPAAAGGRLQDTMRGLQGRYAASHAGRHHDMITEVDARRRGHQPSEVEDLQGTPIVAGGGGGGGGRIADVETVPPAEVSASSEKPPTSTIDDDNDFLRSDDWEPKRPHKSYIPVDTEDDTKDLASSTENKHSTSDDDNDFLRSDTWETKRPKEEAVLGERTVITNTVTTQDVSGGDTRPSVPSSGNNDDDNDFLRDDSWEAPKVKATDDKSSAPPVGSNADDDFLREDTREALVHKPVDSSVLSAPVVTNGDNKSSAPPISNNVDDDDFLRDETLETVLTKPADTDVNNANPPEPHLNERNEKPADDHSGKSADDNGSIRGDDLESKPQPVTIDAEVDSVPSAVPSSDDTADNNVDDNDSLSDDPLEEVPPKSEPAVRGGRYADIDADDEDESPNHDPQGNHQPDEHATRYEEEETADRGVGYGEGAHERREEDKDGEEEEEGEGGRRGGGEQDVAWAGRRPLDGSDWPTWAGGDGPRGSTPPRYSSGGFVGGLADGEKLPDEDRHQRQAPPAAHHHAPSAIHHHAPSAIHHHAPPAAHHHAPAAAHHQAPSSAHHQGGPWVQQWLARAGGASAAGGGKAAEAAGAARAAAAEAARRAAHRSSFRRGWRGSGSRDTAHDETWGRRREYNYGLGGGVAGGDRSADLVAGTGGFLWQPLGLWQDGILYL